LRTRILAGPLFAPGVAAKLNFPHLMTVLDRQSDAEIAKIAADTDVIVSAAFTSAWRVPGADRPGLVHSVGAGFEGIDRACLPAGCIVCNVYGHERAVTEEAFMLMLALQKGLFGLDAALRRGDWTPEPPYLFELRGRRLLILGYGHIGAELARFGCFFGMEVTALTRNPSPERAEKHGLRELGALSDLGRHLPGADFVIVAIPHNPDTNNLIGEKEFQKMKPTAFIINVGRAPVVEETALYQALRERRIAGAGLAVWYRYPSGDEKCLPANLPFQELDNIIMTPHKPSLETIDYRIGEIAENIRRFAVGEPLKNVVYTT
jgi:phosphoglycerate dehydrogenase-like enzyme